MFKMISSPHTHSNNLTANFMLWVVGAMLPALVVQWYFFWLRGANSGTLGGRFGDGD